MIDTYFIKNISDESMKFKKNYEALFDDYEALFKLCVEIENENEKLILKNYELRHKYESCLKKKTMYKTEMKRNSKKLSRIYAAFPKPISNILRRL